jgi:hypothetical protein
MLLSLVIEVEIITTRALGPVVVVVVHPPLDLKARVLSVVWVDLEWL